MSTNQSLDTKVEVVIAEVAHIKEILKEIREDMKTSYVSNERVDNVEKDFNTFRDFIYRILWIVVPSTFVLMGNMLLKFLFPNL